MTPAARSNESGAPGPDGQGDVAHAVAQLQHQLRVHLPEWKNIPPIDDIRPFLELKENLNALQQFAEISAAAVRPAERGVWKLLNDPRVSEILTTAFARVSAFVNFYRPRGNPPRWDQEDQTAMALMAVCRALAPLPKLLDKLARLVG
jgi:hypothetical protein